MRVYLYDLELVVVLVAVAHGQSLLPVAGMRIERVAEVVMAAVGVRVGLNPEGLAEDTPTAFVQVPPAAEPSAPELFRARFVIPGGKERVLELAWRDGRREIDRDTEIAVEIFCEHLGDAFDLLKAATAGARPSARPGPTA